MNPDVYVSRDIVELTFIDWQVSIFLSHDSEMDNFGQCFLFFLFTFDLTFTYSIATLTYIKDLNTSSPTALKPLTVDYCELKQALVNPVAVLLVTGQTSI